MKKKLIDLIKYLLMFAGVICYAIIFSMKG